MQNKCCGTFFIISLSLVTVTIRISEFDHLTKIQLLASSFPKIICEAAVVGKLNIKCG